MAKAESLVPVLAIVHQDNLDITLYPTTQEDRDNHIQYKQVIQITPGLSNEDLIRLAGVIDTLSGF